MRCCRIPKGPGRWRTVYVPSRAEKKRYARLAVQLALAERAAAQAAGTLLCAHGFVQGRSAVTAARLHVGYAATITADLADWFDSVRPEQIRAGLYLAGADPALATQACYAGAPRQGLPSSPAAANLAAVELDRLILDRLACVAQGPPVALVYTRYADDLAVSVADPAVAEAVLLALAGAAFAMGWKLAPGKTRVHRASAGRRPLLGLSVGPSDVRASREARRKLRAARFGRGPGAAGLAEWCACRLPRAARPSRLIAGLGGQAVLDRGNRAAPAPGATVLLGGARRIVFPKPKEDEQ